MSGASKDSFFHGLLLGVILGSAVAGLWASRLALLGSSTSGSTRSSVSPSSDTSDPAPAQQTAAGQAQPATSLEESTVSWFPDQRSSWSSPGPSWAPVHIYIGSQTVEQVRARYGDASPPDRPGQLHSQLTQDRDVALLLNCKRNGFFIDLAANDPVWISNTRFLERDLGFTGVCVDANERYWHSLAHRRGCSVVGAPVGNENDAEVVLALRPDAPWLGGVVAKNTDNTPAPGGTTKKAKRRTVRLDTVLDFVNAPRTIDYLSLDVEGFETEVLKNYDFGKREITVLTVERPKPSLTKVLVAEKYVNVTPAHYAAVGETLWVFGMTQSEAEERLRGNCVEEVLGRLKRGEG